jgi:uncharacterized protein with PQ loop repeat
MVEYSNKTMYFAWIANILSFIYKLPQIYTLYKKKNTTGLNVYSFCIQATSYVLYILHGYFTNDDALFYGMMPSLIQTTVIIIMYIWINYHYKREQNNG